VLWHQALVFDGSLAAYVTERSRALDELAFSPGAFLVVYGLTGEAPRFPGLPSQPLCVCVFLCEVR
jgi:hypothetical protein